MIIEDKNNVSTDDYAIRRLTPRECWRLMDFPTVILTRQKQQE